MPTFPSSQAVRLDIQTAGALRPWHGHVTGFQRLASNGGLARYRLRIEPWLALARLRQDSFLFQHLSVKDIADSIFADYQGPAVAGAVLERLAEGRAMTRVKVAAGKGGDFKYKVE